MKHRVRKKQMNTDTDHRKAILRNLSAQLIIHGSITTTEAKAKYFKPYVERLVTKAKNGPSFSNLNLVNSRLRSKEALRVLFEDIAPRFKNRNGGYTRIVKLGYRAGDRAPMAKIEWVESKTKKPESKTKDSASVSSESKKADSIAKKGVATKKSTTKKSKESKKESKEVNSKEKSNEN